MPRDARVSVPLGGGVNEGPHEWLLRPPQAIEVQNFDLDSDGAYTKRTGWDAIATVSGSTGVVLLPQRDALGVIGSDGLSVLAGSTLTAQTVGGHVPTRVESHPVMAFRGAVSGAQIAYNGGNLGIILHEVDEEEGRNAVILVLNSNYEIVYGPTRSASLAHFPSVTPLGSGFLFTGVADDANFTVTSSAFEGDLYGLYTDGSTVNGPTSIATISGLPYDSTYGTRMYDIYGVSGESVAYLAYRKVIGPADYDLMLANVTSGIVVTEGTELVNGIAAWGNMAVWHDTTSQTVLVFWGESTGTLYYRTEGVGGGGSIACTLSSANDGLPVFYEKGDGSLWLSDRQITITGSNPGTPSAAAVAGYDVQVHRRPQPREPDSAFHFEEYYRTRASTTGLGDRLHGGGFKLLGLDVDGTDEFDRDVVPLQQGRADLWYMLHDHNYWYNNAGANAAYHAHVLGQSAYNAGKIYVPHLIANGAYLAPPLWKETDAHVDADGNVTVAAADANFGRGISSDGVDDWEIVGREGGAGVNEGVLQLVVTEIDTTTVSGSAVDLHGSMVVAAGGLSIFDGQKSLPAVLEKPSSATLAGTAAKTLFPYVTEPLAIENGKSITFYGVLVWIDRNGVKYRSDSFDIGSISNATGSTAYYQPEIQVTARKSHMQLIKLGTSLTLELYATDTYTTGATPGASNLAWRGALIQSGATTTLTAATADNGIYNVTTYSTAGPNIHEGSSTFNPTTLYTDSGELGPALPPASNVLCHAGNYLFLLPSEDPWTVWHTKPLSSFIGPEFNSTLTLRMPAESGGCVSLAGESDRVLFLCKNGIWELFVAGTGPDVNGDGSFPAMRKVYAGDGCISHSCTVSGPFGTFFVAHSGPKIVGRDGSIVDIGEALDVNPTLHKFASYIPSTREVWLWATSDAYVLDTSSMQWTYSTMDAIAATVRDRTIYRVNTSNSLRSANTATLTDNSTVYVARYTSPWLVLSGQVGYSRVRKVGVLIQPLAGSHGKILVDLAYDYNNSTVDTFTFDYSTMEALDRPIHLWVRPTRQKNDAIRVTVRDGTETVGQSELLNIRWALVAIELEARAKGGMIRLQQEAKA